MAAEVGHQQYTVERSYSSPEAVSIIEKQIDLPASTEMIPDIQNFPSSPITIEDAPLIRHTLSDGREFSGTREQAMKLCPYLAQLSMEKKEEILDKKVAAEDSKEQMKALLLIMKQDAGKQDEKQPAAAKIEATDKTGISSKETLASAAAAGTAKVQPEAASTVIAAQSPPRQPNPTSANALAAEQSAKPAVTAPALASVERAVSEPAIPDTAKRIEAAANQAVGPLGVAIRREAVTHSRTEQAANDVGAALLESTANDPEPVITYYETLAVPHHPSNSQQAALAEELDRQHQAARAASTEAGRTAALRPDIAPEPPIRETTIDSIGQELPPAIEPRQVIEPGEHFSLPLETSEVFETDEASFEASSTASLEIPGLPADSPAEELETGFDAASAETSPNISSEEKITRPGVTEQKTITEAEAYRTYLLLTGENQEMTGSEQPTPAYQQFEDILDTTITAGLEADPAGSTDAPAAATFSELLIEQELSGTETGSKETIQPEKPSLPRITLDEQSQKLETTCLQLAEYFQAGTRNETARPNLPQETPKETEIMNILEDIGQLLDKQLSTQPSPEETAGSNEPALTPEITHKLLDFIQALGYDRPAETLASLSRRQGNGFLLDMAHELARLSRPDTQPELLIYQANAAPRNRASGAQPAALTFSSIGQLVIAALRSNRPSPQSLAA